ncbi:hypothetical protein AMTRI_Chr13g123960 [Amborella trichopoda]|uniref:Glycosyltransferase N-terminal domain-containing protein n=1 Tax=Amborella trichopoda TaxID=13333 RepID=U5D1X9_AMBTC|nr:putative UDP-rhamnose:rhamnosyltransferase 1 [Amborella trichopoda]ERN14368.1 hypothetical protein AMTR_s00033p00222830 [Amborella trichopoda]|eukprot:XP_006852901.1 putative UDP-rhamnose:rhamnosyltransferase 1 [Amborella trichopoda]
MERENVHVVMVPWLAFGHMIPFFELSKALAQKGITVSFISTPRNLQRLPPTPPELAPQINLVGFPLPSVEGLPKNAEATTDIPLKKVPYLKKAYDGLRAPFEELVAKVSPDWIVVDFAPYWATSIASKYGVPCCWFNAVSTAFTVFLGPPHSLKGLCRTTTVDELMVVPEWITFPSTIAFRRHEAQAFLQQVLTNLHNGSGVSDWYRVQSILEGCRVVAFRTGKEFDGDYIDLFEKLYEKSVFPLGFLPPSQAEREGNDNSWIDENKWSTAFEWLDAQPLRSVVFVGFGSECRLSIEQVHEIAYGLELSKLPFVWALRKPFETHDGLEILPKGFEGRTERQGIICIGWAPQQRIFAHPSIGGCLFHSGWGSIIEALSHGLALILLPFIIDQGINARLLGEKKLGFEVERNEDDGSFTKVSIAKALRFVMVEEEGEPLRVKAREMKPIFGNKELSDMYLDGFANFLKNNK